MPKSNLTTTYKLHLSADARDRINYLLETTDCRDVHELFESLLAREEAIVRNMHAVLIDQAKRKQS